MSSFFRNTDPQQYQYAIPKSGSGVGGNIPSNPKWENADQLLFAGGVVAGTILMVTLLRELWFSIKDTFDSPVLNKFVYELLATLELTVAQYELSLIVYPNYPFSFYFIGLLVYSLWVNFREHTLVRNCQTTCANPILILRKCMNGEFDGTTAFILATGQFIGALLAYPLVISPTWSVASNWFFSEFNLHNMEISAHYWPTEAMVSNPWLSAFAEGSVTAAICLMPAILRNFDFDPITETHVFIILSTCIAASTKFSGAFFNPAVATGLELTTVGLCTETKIFIYWIIPCLGMVIAWLCEPLITP